MPMTQITMNVYIERLNHIKIMNTFSNGIVDGIFDCNIVCYIIAVDQVKGAQHVKEIIYAGACCRRKVR